MVEQGIRLIVITTDYSVICSDYSSEDKKMQKYVEQIDKRTGEVMDGCMVWIPHRPKLTERWFMAFQDSFIELAKDQELTLEHKNILLYLFGRLDFENFIQQSQSEIAESLGMQKQNVSRAMKTLIQKQIVLEGPKVGRSKCYRLNPNYGWKGKVKTLQEHRREQFKIIQGGIGKAENQK